MYEEYQDDSNNSDEGMGKGLGYKKMTKNQQIYGDFEQAYEPQLNYQSSSKNKYYYQQFKSGSTIQRYTSEIEVFLPQKTKHNLNKSSQNQQPALGKFSLSSFLNSVNDNGLGEVAEESNEDSSNRIPQGLNEKIRSKMELYKMGQQQYQEQMRVQEMSYEAYIKLSRPAKQKIQPKYKTEQQKELAKQFREGYGIGFKMLEKMGYKVTKGLGKDQEGINRPVEAIFKTAFTMRDEPNRNQHPKHSQQQVEQQQEQKKEVPIAEQLFQYKSKNKQINNLLLDLKIKYQKLQSQIFQSKSQIESFNRQAQLNDNIRYQCENQIAELNSQISKLKQLSANIYDCSQFPHLALKYKLDLLYVRECYNGVSKYTFDELCKYGQNQLRNLTQILHKLYRSKYNESLRSFEQKTGIQKKINKQMAKLNQQEVIDLDTINEKGQLGLEEQDKMGRYMEVIIRRCFLWKIEEMWGKWTAIERLSNMKIIQILQVIKKYDRKGMVFAEFIKDNITSTINQYLAHLVINSHHRPNKLLPHQVIFPWLTIIDIQQLDLFSFFHKVAATIWSLQDEFLYNLVSPWIKFTMKKQYNYLIHLYLAPRLLNQMESFNINQPNLEILNAFTKYSQLLPFNLRQEILENTLLLQVHQAYNQYKQKLEEKQLRKWMGRWKKYVDKISPGFFQTYFKQYSIIV